MRSRGLKTMYAAGALLLAAGLSACGGGGDSGSGDLGLLQSGSLTVCSDVPYPPFDVQKGSTYTGFDGDLVAAMAKNMDLKVVLKDSSFDGLQSGLSLNSNQCDMVSSAMTITPEREKNIDFSKPYYDSKQSLLVPKGSDIKSIDDLAGKKVGVQQGTTGKTYTEENAPSSTQVVSFPSDGEMFPAIKAGQVDALLQDLPVNLDHTKGGDFTIVETYDTGEQYGFAVREKGSEPLLKEINKQLQKLRDDGTYDKLYNKYFSTNAGG
ncbi:MAG TPA: basic amino acid ABC transporter substrate-binding protein [Nocardioidaceae bacterium]